MVFMLTNLTFLTSPKARGKITRESCIAKGMTDDYEEDPENLLEGPFFTRGMILHSRPDGFMLYLSSVLTFLQHRNYYIQL